MCNEAALTPLRVKEIFESCKYDPVKDGADIIIVKGFTRIAMFNSRRLDAMRSAIIGIVSQLHQDLYAGAPVSRAFYKYDGKRWVSASNLCCVDQLLALGVAIGEMAISEPPDQWIGAGDPHNQYIVIN